MYKTNTKKVKVVKNDNFCNYKVGSAITIWGAIKYIKHGRILLFKINPYQKFVVAKNCIKNEL